jgi:hypothetical protein
MKKIYFILLCLGLTVSVYSQKPISIDRIINGLDWENCCESDVILTFKDNVVKRDKVETWDDGSVSSFILKNVKVGDSVSDANIIVSKYNKKLLKIGGITLENLDWSKGADVLSQELENYFSTFWGKEHKKSIDYDADFLDESIVYTNIKCEWENTRLNEKSSKGSFYLMHRAKIIVIAIEPK